jgi:hypothetical protein
MLVGMHRKVLQDFANVRLLSESSKPVKSRTGTELSGNPVCPGLTTISSLRTIRPAKSPPTFPVGNIPNIVTYLWSGC